MDMGNKEYYFSVSPPFCLKILPKQKTTKAVIVAQEATINIHPPAVMVWPPP